MSVASEAEEAVLNRRERYGHPRKNFSDIAKGWSVILGVEVTEQQVAQCFVWTKQCREIHKHDRDNLVDIVGYTLCLEELAE